MLDLESLGITKEDLIERIVEASVEQIASCDVRSEVRQKAMARMEEKVTKGVDEMVNEVQRTALDREFQPLHAWGEAAGPRSTLRQMLLERAGKYLQERVTNDGKTYTGTYDIDKQPTRAQWLARQAVDASFKAEVQAEVAKIVAEMQTRIRAAVGAAVAAVVTEKIR